MSRSARVFILVVGLIGAIVGGAWLGLIVSVLLRSCDSAWDLAAMTIVLLLLCATAPWLEEAGGRRALRVFSLTAATATAATAFATS